MKQLLALVMTFVAFNAFAVGVDGRPSPISKSGSSSDNFMVKPSESTLMWEGKKLTGAHNGKIKIKSGELVFKGPQFVGGEFVIDMTTISVDDLKEADKANRLKNHLESDDFFSTSKFKTAKFVIKDVQFGKGGMYDVTGDLTIKGKTHPISFMADVTESGNTLVAKADIVFNRAKYDVKFGSGSFFDNLGDKLIYDDISLKVELKAQK